MWTKGYCGMVLAGCNDLLTTLRTLRSVECSNAALLIRSTFQMQIVCFP